jgi:protein O-GlcNAc transferase
MRACFPSTTIETIDYWEDFAKLDRTFVFDRVIIVSRETSGRQYVVLLFYAFKSL